jgi:hypothetical protein
MSSNQSALKVQVILCSICVFLELFFVFSFHDLYIILRFIPLFDLLQCTLRIIALD